MESHLVDKSACGVGFAASRTGVPGRAPLDQALHALLCVEHRGACAADGKTGDGAGVMTDIPFALLGYPPGEIAVATLFIAGEASQRYEILDLCARTFDFFGFKTVARRMVPVRPEVLGPHAARTLPQIVQVVLSRPPWCRTAASVNTLLYHVKQATRSKLNDAGLFDALTFVSLSTTTIVYKALCRSADLAHFYPDLGRPEFVTRFALFHRRFSTNTRTAWDKAQPFRLIAHNGEINTIAGNRSWAYSREQALGVRRDELLTHDNISDSGNLNEMVEALKYRSSIPHLEDVLAIMMPPASQRNEYYRFYGRAMEPWDGPAFITYADGDSIGGRLDRNGFRPCRWAMTHDAFFLASEAGVFPLAEADILAKGALHAGTGVKIDLVSGEVHHRDPSLSRENRDARFDARLSPLLELTSDPAPATHPRLRLYGVSHDVLERLLWPMIATGKEPIGSMGDTAAPAILSREPRPLFDFFYQQFAQVTNPPFDYLREAMVTDLSTVIGKRPNIFAPKELLPPAPAVIAESPVLTPAQLAYLRSLTRRSQGLKTQEIDCTLPRPVSKTSLRHALDEVAARALKAASDGFSVIILSDRAATPERPPIPSLLALRSAVGELNRQGLRLEASVVVEAGDALTSHAVACLIAFGAVAVCPHLAFAVAAGATHRELAHLSPREREQNLAQALIQGLLKVMSKMGISVAQSYQSAKLFAALGLGAELGEAYFRGVYSPVGGLGFADIATMIERQAADALVDAPPASVYLFKEDNKGVRGLHHAMTAARAKLVHDAVRAQDPAEVAEAFAAYLSLGEATEPTSLRHLFALRPAAQPLPLDDVESRAAILRTFGAGAMSFGAISAEAQRDVMKAMREIGGRSNSGEGGENPYYFMDGTTAYTKQIASARFGVTAEYVVSGEEAEIKIGQGAKPGEGGQLMGAKVDEHIARARHATPHVDLISPPPLHDIYSIEDLKELIYELKELKPTLRVAVKLVAGAHIGTIAVGVAKAGANVIQISGGDGGTGAATLTSMKHAGLPWELSLAEAHRALLEQGLRAQVVLRVDGGLHSGRDVVQAAILGAEEFGFGKLILVAQGCIMARVCEKNRCPTGIATHDPKFKAKYRGEPAHIVRLLAQLADEVRAILGHIGAHSLREVLGRTDLLVPAARHTQLIAERGIDLATLTTPAPHAAARAGPKLHLVGALNQRVLDEVAALRASGTPVDLHYDIRSTDRAVPVRLCGVLAQEARARRMAAQAERPGHFDFGSYDFPEGLARLTFRGSAGQGFAAFLTAGIDLRLEGEANDSVCKSMSGGRVVVRPATAARFVPHENVILGNCALYGATGGTLYVHGKAGDRFAVRNSGAVAVVEGAGLHACEYMTGGTVVILGPVSYNVGAGMTGGRIVLRREHVAMLNPDYLMLSDLGAHAQEVHALLTGYLDATGSATAQALLADWPRAEQVLCVAMPRRALPLPVQAAAHANAAARAGRLPAAPSAEEGRT